MSWGRSPKGMSPIRQRWNYQEKVLKIANHLQKFPNATYDDLCKVSGFSKKQVWRVKAGIHPTFWDKVPQEWKDALPEIKKPKKIGGLRTEVDDWIKNLPDPEEIENGP